MPETGKEQNRPAQKPNWVDIGTFGVLTLTLIVVGIYTCEARRQNGLTQRVIETQTRPFLVVKFLPEEFGYKVSPPPVDERRALSVSFQVEDYGKLPATAEVRSVAVYKEGGVPVDELKKEPLRGLPQ